MRRRFLAAFVVLDGLCALASPLIAPGLMPGFGAPDSGDQVAYVEIAGMCVQEIQAPGADLAGRPVPMSFCAGS